MPKIKVALFGDIYILLEGIASLLNDSSEIEVNNIFCDYKDLITELKKYETNIIIYALYSFEKKDIEIIIDLKASFPKLKIIMLVLKDEEDNVLKSLKAGAKGYITKDTNQSELFEAIFSVHNGLDYHSKSIANVLVKNYLKIINSGSSKSYKHELELLSKREIEIIKLWGESFTNAEIAERLCISVRTVESHKNHIMQKLNMKTTVDLVKFAIKNNLIKI
jgi:two-component system response regulator NreC